MWSCPCPRWTPSPPPGRRCTWRCGAAGRRCSQATLGGEAARPRTWSPRRRMARGALARGAVAAAASVGGAARAAFVACGGGGGAGRHPRARGLPHRRPGTVALARGGGRCREAGSTTPIRCRLAVETLRASRLPVVRAAGVARVARAGFRSRRGLGDGPPAWVVCAGTTYGPAKTWPAPRMAECCASSSCRPDSGCSCSAKRGRRIRRADARGRWRALAPRDRGRAGRRRSRGPHRIARGRGAAQGRRGVRRQRQRPDAPGCRARRADCRPLRLLQSAWTAPRGPCAQALAADGFPCRPCFRRTCNQPRFCLDSNPAQVFAARRRWRCAAGGAARELLACRRCPAAGPPAPALFLDRDGVMIEEKDYLSDAGSGALPGRHRGPAPRPRRGLPAGRRLQPVRDRARPVRRAEFAPSAAGRRTGSHRRVAGRALLLPARAAGQLPLPQAGARPARGGLAAPSPGIRRGRG